jgi:peroxiredoxin
MERSETSGGVAVGALAPNFRLASAQGPDIALEDYRGQRNVVLWFSRGLYCPFCRRYMAQLHLGYKEIQARETEILEVTYSTPEEARLYFRQYQLWFPYLCDPERSIFRLYGLSTVQRKIKDMAASMTAAIGDRLFRGEKGPSPLPYIKRYGSTDLEQAVFIIDKAGVIRYVHTTGAPGGGLPSNAEYLRQLDKLQ